MRRGHMNSGKISTQKVEGFDYIPQVILLITLQVHLTDNTRVNRM